jgi:hypothetical protein
LGGDPRLLQRMFAISVEALNCRNCGTGNTANWSDARALGNAVNMDGTSTAHAYAATKLRALEV